MILFSEWHQTKRCVRSLLIMMAGAFLVFIPAASAYVISGSHILHNMIKQLGKADTLLATGELRLFGEEHQEDLLPATETTSYRFPDQFRADTTFGDNRKIFISSFDHSVTMINEEIAASSETIYDAYKDILLYRTDTLMPQALKKLGVDTSVSSIGRFRGRVVYVVGADYPDEAVSQVMVDKKTFLPIRLIVIKQSLNVVKDSVDVHYLNWKKDGETWFPGKIQFFFNKKKAREFIIKNIVFNPSLEARVFDIKSLTSEYQKRSEAEKEQKNEPVDEVRKTIDDFSKIYE